MGSLCATSPETHRSRALLLGVAAALLVVASRGSGPAPPATTLLTASGTQRPPAPGATRRPGARVAAPLRRFPSPHTRALATPSAGRPTPPAASLRGSGPPTSLCAAALLFLLLPLGVALRRHLRPSPSRSPVPFWAIVTAAASAAASGGAITVDAEVVDAPPPPPDAPPPSADGEVRLCCPTCQRPLVGTVCRPCGLRYENLGTFVDLTPASGRPLVETSSSAPSKEGTPAGTWPWVKDALPTIERLERALPPPAGVPRLSRLLRGEYRGDRSTWGTATFESPVVASVYERGWRQSFARAGFPGPDAEFERALAWLRPVAEGQAVVDVSCGSGLFTRRFVACGTFSKVIALDYSESMLQQTRQGIDADPNLKRQAVAVDLELVRADVARLPFPSASLSAVHAGAAIHCWPAPTLAMAEIARVLRPGGRAVLSTFLVPGQESPLLNEALRGILAAPTSGSGIRYWEESELRDLCSRVGLVNFEAERRRDSILFKVERPAA